MVVEIDLFVDIYEPTTEVRQANQGSALEKTKLTLVLHLTSKKMLSNKILK